jgi:hypothetical protein
MKPMNLINRKLPLCLAICIGLAVGSSSFAATSVTSNDDDDEGPVLQGGITKNVVITETGINGNVSKLGGYDVVVLVDRSHSMDRRDCPLPPQEQSVLYGAGTDDDYYPYYDEEAQKKQRKKNRGKRLSRWEWCRNQTLSFARDTAPISQDGLTLVTFSDYVNVYHNVGVGKIASAFAYEQPSGNTDTATALSEQLEDYFVRRHESGGKVRPLAVAIITDGAPNNPKRLRHVIADATQRMNRPDELSITFLQVGNDWRGYELFHDLQKQLRRNGAVYDIVTVRPFKELKTIGLTRALVESITDRTVEEVDDETAARRGGRSHG